MPRDTSVNRSAVSRSPSSLACPMACRAALPKAARADDRASTWLRPSAALAGYSGSELRLATIRAVPSATPPSCTARSAISSTYSSTSSLILSNSRCRLMNFGPLTFQWACLTGVCKSLQSPSRALSSSIALTRVASGRSFLVLNMAMLLFHNRSVGMPGGGGLGSQEGQQVLVDPILVRRAQAVRGALVDPQGPALD